MRAFEGYPAPFGFGWGGCEDTAALGADCGTIAGGPASGRGESQPSVPGPGLSGHPGPAPGMVAGHGGRSRPRAAGRGQCARR